MLNNVDKQLLDMIADMNPDEVSGAYNIRKDCGCASRAVTENINIESRPCSTYSVQKARRKQYSVPL